MWAMRRGLNLEAMPPTKVVLQFDLRGIRKGPRKERSYWMVVESKCVDVCFTDPGFQVDVVIFADLSAFTHVVMGYDDLDQALKQGSIAFEGPHDYRAAAPHLALPARGTTLPIGDSAYRFWQMA